MKEAVSKKGRLTSLVMGLITALGVTATAGTAVADPNWPNKPVVIIVPFPAGGGTDAFARPLTTMMNKLTGKQFKDWNIDSAWHGIYPKMTNGATEWIQQIDEVVTIVNGMGGNGMTLSFGLGEEVVAGMGE